MKRISVWLFFSLCVFLFYGYGWASSSVISVTGVVRQPLNMSIADLEKFDSATVQLTEITSDRSFHGAFHYKGVPLKTLLDFADVEKEESDFSKRIDLAVIVRNKKGEQVTLSWGEVFYQNPAKLAANILKGSRPGELPVEIADSVLTINLKAADELGLEIPNTILRQANVLVYSD